MKKTKSVSDVYTIRFPYLWILLAIILVYGNSIYFGITHLDDKIFIIENAEYNRDFSNIIHSFKRGVFSEDRDTYYRPVLLISYILEFPIHGQNPQGYHIVNLILHIVCSILVYLLLLKLLSNKIQAFIFALIFSVHPVLSQAVVWIPGRNDTLLMLFLCGFLISYLRYTESKNLLYYLFQLFFLLLALFTKESALAAPFIALLITFYVHEKNINTNTFASLFAAWVLAFGCWYYLRTQATLQSSQADISVYIDSFFYHAPVTIQYIGKILFPFNLSVFAMQEDTVYYYGIAAILLISLLIYFAKNKNIKLIVFGILWFAAFMGPALLIPKGVNDQVFEHRLYIPILGIFLLLSQSVLFLNKIKPQYLVYGGVGIATLLGMGSYAHSQLFKDEITFWESAVETSPNSSYARALLGIKYYFRNRKPEAEQMIKKSYQINPKERYVNHYMGKFHLERNSADSAEKYFRRETEISNFYESWFELAHVAFLKKDLVAAEKALSKAVLFMKYDPVVNTNLLLLYIDLKDYAKAKQQINSMKEKGLEIPAGMEEKIKAESQIPDNQ